MLISAVATGQTQAIYLHSESQLRCAGALSTMGEIEGKGLTQDNKWEIIHTKLKEKRFVMGPTEKSGQNGTG